MVGGQATLARVLQAAGEVGAIVSAATAAPLRAPKLMPETLTSEAGRKAPCRPCAAPSTLAHGSGGSAASVRGEGYGKAAGLTIR